jgi:hypothetical protein
MSKRLTMKQLNTLNKKGYLSKKDTEPMSDAEFTKDNAKELKCPYCGSKNVQHDGIRVCGTVGTETCQCKYCDRDWEIRYRVEMVGYVERTSNGKVVPHKVEPKSLESWREEAADDAWENTDDLFDGLTVEDSEGWEHATNDPYWVRTFYYVNPDEPEGDTRKATFVVEFEKDSFVMKDIHINW